MVKFCLHCGEVLSDELVELDGMIVDTCDYEERIHELLKMEGIEPNGRDIIYYCFNCHTLFLINFNKKQVRWVDWKNFRGGLVSDAARRIIRQ